MSAWANITWRHIEQVRAALDAGADVNAVVGESQVTPLFCALQEGTPEVVELLLAHGADVEATHRSGWTPLWAAVRVQQIMM
jgi:ankyrin repeat protein